jgi:hypothetical protein
MNFAQDPSKDVVFNRIPNFYIEDNAGIFGLKLGLLAYPFSTENFLVDKQPIKLLVYTRSDDKISFPYLSSNAVAILISVSKDDVLLRIRISDDLLTKSRFKRNKDEMYKLVLKRKKNEIVIRNVSIAYLLSFFDNYNELLFPMSSSFNIEDIPRKSICIEWKGEKPVDENDSTKQAPPDEPENSDLNVIIGLFFDGTNNSRFNTEVGYKEIIKELERRKKTEKDVDFEKVLEDFQNGTSKAKDYIEDGSSYVDDYSNIVYLFDMYTDETDAENTIVLKHYIQGIGPETTVDDQYNIGEDSYKKDSILEKGSAALGGRSSITDRRNLGIQVVVRKIKDTLDEKKQKINKITFDLFGYSRGATVARTFCNELKKEASLKYSSVYEPNKFFKSAGGYFAEVFFEIIVENDIAKFKDTFPQIDFRFLGLFDTVDKTVSPPKPSISLKECEAFCCHITAHPEDEYRKNFPLVKSDAPFGVDLTLYGAHADVGGGYANRKYSQIIDRYVLLNAENTSERLIKLKDQFSKQFALIKEDLNFIENYKQLNINKQECHRDYQKVVKLELIDSRYIENSIHKVSLNAMIKIAKMFNIQFDDELEGNSTITNIDTSDKPLFAYNTRVQELIDETSNSKQNKCVKLDAEFYFALYNKYIHISSSYREMALGGILIINQPTKDRKREILSP